MSLTVTLGNGCKSCLIEFSTIYLMSLLPTQVMSIVQWYCCDPKAGRTPTEVPLSKKNAKTRYGGLLLHAAAEVLAWLNVVVRFNIGFSEARV